MAYQCEQEEMKGREIFKFEREGATLEGAFMGKEIKVMTVEREGRKVTEKNTVLVFGELSDSGVPTGKEFETIEAADLKAKVSPQKIGHYFTIRWGSSQQTKGGNSMKVYDVMCSKQRVPYFATPNSSEMGENRGGGDNYHGQF